MEARGGGASVLVNRYVARSRCMLFVIMLISPGMGLQQEKIKRVGGV